MDRGAWQAVVHSVTKSWTQRKRLSTHMHALSVLTLPAVSVVPAVLLCARPAWKGQGSRDCAVSHLG